MDGSSGGERAQVCGHLITYRRRYSVNSRGFITGNAYIVGLHLQFYTAAVLHLRPCNWLINLLYFLFYIINAWI